MQNHPPSALLTVWLNSLIFSLLALLLLPLASCCKQELPPTDVDIFLAIPSNKSVFDNIRTLLYEATHQHLLHAGFSLVDSAEHGYTIQIQLKRLDPLDKLISPDIVLLNYTAQLDFTLQIQTSAKRVIHTHDFSCSALISRPRNPILNSDFTYEAYRVLAARAARMVQQYLLRHHRTIFAS